jgi:hypothetical protein
VSIRGCCEATMEANTTSTSKVRRPNVGSKRAPGWEWIDERRRRRIERYLNDSDLPREKTLATLSRARLPAKVAKILPTLCGGVLGGGRHASRRGDGRKEQGQERQRRAMPLERASTDGHEPKQWSHPSRVVLPACGWGRRRLRIFESFWRGSASRSSPRTAPEERADRILHCTMGGRRGPHRRVPSPWGREDPGILIGHRMDVPTGTIGHLRFPPPIPTAPTRARPIPTPSTRRSRWDPMNPAPPVMRVDLDIWRSGAPLQRTCCPAVREARQGNAEVAGCEPDAPAHR